MSTIVKVVRLVAVAAVALSFGCATPGSGDGFNAFLQKIAADCKPLIIGSDDIGQAIIFNGLGAQPEHFNSFLAKTDALYHGGISQQIYRDSLTSFVGTGSYNARSFECIVAHLPGSPTAGTTPAK